MGSTRALWRGVLSVGSISLPVRMITVDESASTVSFNHAHRCAPNRLTRLQQKKWCPTCDRQLKQTDVVRVFEYAPGQYLEVTDAELATCEPTPSSSLTITATLDAPVKPLFISDTAYLVSDGPAAAELLEIFRAALGTRHVIGQMVLHKRVVHVTIAALERGCVVHLLRTAEQVKAFSDVDGESPSPTVSRARVQDVRALLHQLVDRFNYDDVRDEHAVNVRALITARVSIATRDATRASATNPTPRRRVLPGRRRERALRGAP